MNCAQPTTLGKCTVPGHASRQTDESDVQHLVLTRKPKGAQTYVEDWKALLSLFRANSRDVLVTMLGLSKTRA